ncbi:hypothetical protein KO566_12945 [Flavobacteriaceae bacterium XHP0103]|uniref:hypothetical protein n=1 Tax=Marixanthotalea marina TaxID=2844359 RepID=UPI00298A0227|nr:hypothetical protein [Marixanthotalea marina]MBU3822971.1 hypothetical protein [Marixanthotalea marina]
MKKINLLFIAIILVFASCSTEDASPEISSNILGDWNAVSINYTAETTTTFSGQTLTNNAVGEGYDINIVVTFSESPNTVVSQGNYNVHLTSTVLDQTYTQDVVGPEFFQDGTWEQNGNKLIVTAQGETSEATIEKLTDSELELYIDTTEDLSEQGATIISKIKARYKFTR